MSTYDEISTSPELNRAYWSEWARFYLAMKREHQNDPRQFLSYRRAFRSAMRARRAAEYLEKQA